jgi:hypothetical protein
LTVSNHNENGSLQGKFYSWRKSEGGAVSGVNHEFHDYIIGLIAPHVGLAPQDAWIVAHASQNTDANDIPWPTATDGKIAKTINRPTFTVFKRPSKRIRTKPGKSWRIEISRAWSFRSCRKRKMKMQNDKFQDLTPFILEK